MKNNWTEEKFERALKEGIEWFMPDYQEIDGERIDVNRDNMFFQEFFLHYHNMTRRQFHVLKKRYPFHEDLIERLKEIQEFKIAKMGLLKQTSESLTKYMLGNLHKDNWQEKVVNENSLEIRDFDIKDLIRFKND